MWARIIEVNIGCWLAISPFIFHHPLEAKMLWWNDLACAFVIIAMALISFWQPARYIHLAIGLVALWLIVFGYLTSLPVTPAVQNNVLIGWLLLMFTVIPNKANEAPRAWINFTDGR